MKGVISAGHEVTAEAGAEILRAGGNAFDAVLGAMFASTVPEAILSSLGGGGFLMARPADGKSVLYDFFVDTPRVKRPLEDLDFHAIHADFGPATQEFHIGVGSAAMPGIVPGAYGVHRDLCTMPMADLLKPAIEAARNGVTVNDFHAYLYTIVEPILRSSPNVERLYAPGGILLKAGDNYRNPQLAETFEALGREGEMLFSSGAVGAEILNQSETHGGHLCRDDLDEYQVIKRVPLGWRHGVFDLEFNPAPALGGALIAYGLGLVDELGRARSGAALSVSDLIDVMALTNEARARHGCELESLTDRNRIAKHLREAQQHTAQNRGTTHISVIDGTGNAASLTLSNGEGSGHMLGDFGIMLNNMLGEEDLNPDGFHQWVPGRRLSTMMAPTIMCGADGRLVALGSGGSNRIRTALLQVIVHLIDGGLNLESAVDHPRLHLERDGVLSFEDLFEEDIRAEIIASSGKSHPWPEPNMFFGGVNSVERTAGDKLLGVGDRRRGGAAIVVG